MPKEDNIFNNSYDYENDKTELVSCVNPNLINQRKNDLKDYVNSSINSTQIIKNKHLKTQEINFSNRSKSKSCGNSENENTPRKNNYETLIEIVANLNQRKIKNNFSCEKNNKNPENQKYMKEEIKNLQIEDLTSSKSVIINSTPSKNINFENFLNEKSLINFKLPKESIFVNHNEINAEKKFNGKKFFVFYLI